MAGRSELDSATSMYYLGILKELTLTLKVAMETYQTGVIATIGAVATLACLEEADVSLFAINDEFHQTIIENIPAPGIIIETFPAYDETGIRIWVTPISDQKTLTDSLVLAEENEEENSSKNEGETDSNSNKEEGKLKRETPEQKALRDLAKESAKRAKQGKPISKEEADILDEWANEYKVPQHHQA